MTTSRRSAAGRFTRPRIVVLSLMALVGLGSGFASWWLQDIDPWCSTMLANVAVVVLLLIPGELALSRFRQQVDNIDEAAANASGAANVALDRAESATESLANVRERLVADSAPKTLANVREQLIQDQIDELDDVVGLYEGIGKKGDRASLIKALRRATDDDVITGAGVRAPVWETALHYRFVLSDDDTLTVHLEKDDGSVLSVHPWPAEMPMAAFYQTLVQGIRDTGNDLGTGLNDPTESVRELSEMLVDVTRLRSQDLLGHRQILRKIIERRNGWYFTETSIIPAEHLHYVVDVSRLNEMDWEEHLRDKGWYTAPDALEFARRMYKVTGQPPRPRRRFDSV